MKFSIRGIYSTALIEYLLGLGYELVEPTESQRRRFDAKLSSGIPEVLINDTDDREGIVMRGKRECVSTILEDIKRISWHVVVTPIRNDSQEVASARAYFPIEAKNQLDALRSKVTYTTPMHHYFRAGGEALSNIVSLFEELVERGATSEEYVEGKVREMVERLLPSRDDTIYLHHLKPLGKKILLGPGRAYRAGQSLLLKRQIRGFGSYDGLNVPKTPGDLAVSTIRRFEWSMETKYLGLGNRIKGRYINISTPIHLYEKRVWYIDLGIDVIDRPGRGAEVIDRAELDRLLEAGCISKQVHERAISEAERHLSSASS